MNVSDTALDGRFTDRRSEVVSDLPCERRGDTGVYRLVAPEQRRRRSNVPIRADERDTGLRPRDHPRLARDDIRSLASDGDGVRLRFDRFECAPGRSGHETHVRRSDLYLVTSDRLDGVAEDVRVFEAHRRHSRRHRVDDARRVVSATDPDFEDGHVDLLSVEVPERESREGLKERRCVVLDRHLGYVRPDPLHEASHRRLRDLSPPNPDPLAKVTQVRGGVETDVEPRFVEDPLQNAGRTSLAVRPGDLDGGHPFVGIVEGIEQGSRRRRPQLRANPA